jgi:hypothetical protein
MVQRGAYCGMEIFGSSKLVVPICLFWVGWEQHMRPSRENTAASYGQAALRLYRNGNTFPRPLFYVEDPFDNVSD